MELISKDDLEPIIYALTLKDRPERRHKWLLRGFKIVNARPGFLFRYWDCRLKRGNPDDQKMYHEVLEDYKKSIAASKNVVVTPAPEPTMAEMAATAARAVAGWVKAGVPVATPDQYEIRRRVCVSCEHWDSQALRGTGRCKLCGCSTWAKLRLATEKCPVDKWGSLV